MSIRVIIPTKNEARLLPRLLESLSKQSLRSEMHLVVADADSTDNTRNIAEDFGAEVVKGGMPGPGRNAGAQGAAEDWLLFFDADAYIPSPTFCADVLTACEQKQADYAAFRLTEDSFSLRGKLFHWIFATYSRLTQNSIPRMPGTACLVKRSWFERVQGFDEEVVFAEDMDLAQRLHKAGAKFSYLHDLEVKTSLRRYQKDGYLRTGLRFVRSEIYMRTKGPIKRELFPYGFDHA